MRSRRPKPLHLICGRAMVMHVIHALEAVQPATTVVVVGHGGEQVTQRVGSDAPSWANVRFVRQDEQRGTGDAAAVGLGCLDGDDIDDTSTILVLPGDTPLLTSSSIKALVDHHESSGNGATVLTSSMEDPAGYGRIVRHKDGRVLRIVEDRDATHDERAISEINTGIYAFRRDLLGPALRGIDTNNSQAEYYLTDVIDILASRGHRVGAVEAPASETAGVNDRLQLAMAERELRARINRQWLLAGVTMLDPRQAFIDVTVSIGRDVTLFPGVILQGDSRIGDGCQIGPDVRLVDTTVGEKCVVSVTTAVGAVVSDGATVGPFASLEPGSVVDKDASTGSFYTGRP